MKADVEAFEEHVVADLEALEREKAEVEAQLAQLESDFRYLPSPDWPEFAQDQRRELQERLALLEETLAQRRTELEEAERARRREEERTRERLRRRRARAEKQLPGLARDYLQARIELHARLSRARRVVIEAAEDYFAAKREAQAACSKFEENVKVCEPSFEYSHPRYPRPVECLLEHTLSKLDVPEATGLSREEERLLRAFFEDLLAGPTRRGPGEAPWPLDLRGPLPK